MTGNTALARAITDADGIEEAVRGYYGQTLRSSADLRTTACCSAEAMPEHLRAVLSQLHPEVLERFYGCGSPLPPALDGATVLDLGCGSGRDVYLLSALVGPHGRVLGVDMTAEQLAVAERHRAFHAQAFEHAQSNVGFRLGDLSDLAALGVADDSMDVVVSNCVLNLVPDKRRAFAEILRVLKPGGELYFSDVFADRRLPRALLADPVLVGECLAGAMYEEDFRRLLAALGVADARICTSSSIALTDPSIEHRIGFARFRSITWRAFKLPLEDRCEDYGQVATYLGTLAGQPHRFGLDDHHLFETGKPLRVCGNTADMLSASRYAPHFRVSGDKSVHFGLFDCAAGASAASVPGGAAPCC
ncbi:MAG: methyltransferase domain-containing protein [Xanthomonadaceae bacterium]|nr:methyltransferase domain-containing protein [Xanthomonadaceae bacterium]MDE2278137.1 methyltransferase domain-containing protein [Xanthomonadaceae bacterium]MDE2316513.1 methyltransferase domain-containing protein [Xanthomonadaceae bacterium]